MASTRIVWDKRALGLFIGNAPQGRDVGEEVIERMANEANAAAETAIGGRYGGYPNGGILTHPEEPEYSAEMVEGRSGLSWIGFVHCANGAAHADAAKNNTLLKVIGG